MTTIRVSRRARYTSIAKAALNDERLSFRARGVLCWLLDKPDDWHIDSEAMARSAPEGRDAIRTALNELVKVGYLVRTKRQAEKGRWITECSLHEDPAPTTDFQAPVDPSPTTDFQPSDFQPSDNRASVDRASVDRASVSQALVLKTDTEDGYRGLVPKTDTASDVSDAKSARPPDEVWDAVMAVCEVNRSSITTSARGAYNKAVKSLKAVGAEPVEIWRRAEVFRSRWPDVSLTPTALERRWGECDRPNPGPVPLRASPSPGNAPRSVGDRNISVLAEWANRKGVQG